MNKFTMIIITLSAIVVIGGTWFGVSAYKQYKCRNTVQQTYASLGEIRNKINFTRNVIEQTASILLIEEKSNLLESITVVGQELKPIEEDMSKFVKLGDVQLIRAKMEVGFDEIAAKEGYKTPIQRLEELDGKLSVVESYCVDRKKIRDRVVRNEMLLKAILKKPVSGIEMGPDLIHINKYAPQLMKLIPHDTEQTRVALTYIREKNLTNSMGVRLYEALPIVEDIKRIARTNDIKDNAVEMWESAKKSYMNVKPSNDDIHWYVPTNDDGKYDGTLYSKLLTIQAKALSWYENGNDFLERLSNYRGEVSSQKLVYVSSNSYEDTSFRHSRQVERTGYRTRSDGSRERYTYRETEYFRTPGRIFYYTVTTIENNSKSDNRIRVGEKDSHSMMNSFGGWREWSYNTEQTAGYLIEYKPYGYDNRSREVGGRYNPNKHTMR